MKQSTTSKLPDTNKLFKRYIDKHEAMDAIARFHNTPDGNHYVVRFSLVQRIEHIILLLSFSLLGLTGLSQTFSANAVAGLVLRILGGIDSTRLLHHFAAVILGLLFFYHVIFNLYRYLSGDPVPRIIPVRRDFEQLIQMLKFKLGISRKHPRFDRYSFEQKIDYWILISGVIILGLTGCMQWFPVATTYFMPGWAIPVGRAAHKWQAIFLVATAVTWHLYHTVIKKRNSSIFTGLMSLKDMQTEHPLELAYLEQAAGLTNSPAWPMVVEIPLEEIPDPLINDSNANPQTKAGKIETSFDCEATTEVAGDVK